MVFGSDLLGDLHRHQGEEFVLRAAAGIPSAQIIDAATSSAAALFCMQVSAHLCHA